MKDCRNCEHFEMQEITDDNGKLIVTVPYCYYIKSTPSYPFDASLCAGYQSKGGLKKDTSFYL